MSERVTVFGAGYVGLVTGACLASTDADVTVLDIDRDKLAALDAGRCPFFEPGLEDVMRQAKEAGRLHFAPADEVERLSEIVIVAVGTPATATGSADLLSSAPCSRPSSRSPNREPSSS